VNFQSLHPAQLQQHSQQHLAQEYTSASTAISDTASPSYLSRKTTPTQAQVRGAPGPAPPWAQYCAQTEHAMPRPWAGSQVPASGLPPTGPPPLPQAQALQASHPSSQPSALQGSGPTRLRYARSIGGSPPSSEDDEPLLRHVAPASCTYVIRPPSFADPEGPLSTDSLVSLQTVRTVMPGEVWGWGGPVAGSRAGAGRANSSSANPNMTPLSATRMYRSTDATDARPGPGPGPRPLTRGSLDTGPEMSATSKVLSWRQFPVS
jgi:hypothetical protein